MSKLYFLLMQMHLGLKRNDHFCQYDHIKDVRNWSPGLDKGTSVITLATATATATATAEMFPNADDHLGNWVENPSQYN